MAAHTNAEPLQPEVHPQFAPAQLRRGFKTKLLTDFPSKSRRLIWEHRQRRRMLDRKVSDQSRRGLDWTNFFLADVQVSFGAFLAFYLANLSWSKQDVG